MKNIQSIIPKDYDIKLKHSFADACQNKEFMNFAYQLDAPEDILMKYTSNLQDSYNECENCRHCNNLATCKNKVKGYCYKPNVNGNIIEFSYYECPKKALEEKLNAYQNNLKLYSMPQKIKSADFRGLYKDDKARIPILKYFKEFIENYKSDNKQKGVYLTGSFGSGKTYLVAALFNEMAKREVRSAIVYYPEFLRSLKSSFDTNYQEQFDYIKKSPLLLLDDIGAENCSNWSRDEVLGPILQYRMDNELSTFFTSNLTLEELENSLAITSSGVDRLKARRIIERIKQLTNTLELISTNRRN